MGAAAIGALLARVGGGAAMGLPEGPAGVLGGAVVGLGVGAAELGVQGLMNRGGTGGNSAPTPVAPGSISGFRERGRPIDQSMVAPLLP